MSTFIGGEQAEVIRKRQGDVTFTVKIVAIWLFFQFEMLDNEVENS